MIDWVWNVMQVNGGGSQQPEREGSAHNSSLTHNTETDKDRETLGKAKHKNTRGNVRCGRSIHDNHRLLGNCTVSEDPSWDAIQATCVPYIKCTACACDVHSLYDEAAGVYGWSSGRDSSGQVDNMTTSNPIEMAALGRPFTLGMLYDTCKGVLVPGFTLWDTKTLQENTVETSQRCSDFHITASDSIESKSSLLDVEASLKASFLFGLIQVKGSAKYLNDQKKFKNQSRVTLQYKTTTNFKQLSMNKFAILDEQQKVDIEKSSATHVVIGILYGANAVFVFDSEKLDASSVQDIQGSMEAVIKKIPSFDVEGRVSIKLTEKEKALTNKFSCKFFGDLILESNPATFVEAVKTYVELPKLLGENKENAVPLKVWMMPLKNFDSKAAEVKGEVSTGLVKNVENTFEDLGTVEMRLNDCLADSVSKNFPQIRKSLRSFQRQRNNYTSGLHQAIAKTVISIREGKEDESSLKKLLEDREKSPFSHEKLSKWLDHKEREINVIGSCVDMMEGTKTKIVPNQSQLDEEVLAPGVEDALCFVFTSLESADSCLKAMQNYSHSLELSTDEKPWYFSNEVLTKMREKAKAFHDLAKPLKDSSTVRFLATAIANEKHKGATIYHYKEGILVTDDFSKPPVPPVEKIKDKSALMWYACDLSLDPNTVNYNLILSDDNKKVTYGAKQDYPDNPERFDVYPQVLCREGLSGRCYWEVEFSEDYNEEKAVGVAYKQIGRKGNNHIHLGSNAQSWCFGILAVKSKLFAAHNDKWWICSIPSTGFKRVGVYLDWPGGTLSFYNVSSNKLSHLYTFRAHFTQPLYPGCRIHTKTGSLFFRPVD
ncbi:neoverrucotoxin subunit alpha-like [Scomber japonicus]|uniref:neoverrucotoxin subunit alpha-like n=1 Tax=Scomber japonicus TaxID=13676 RepID=UPI002305D0B4|nr:neoverrucotoxin subunit alpha-like [Scomber japonicus]